jgi:hypothetical protein
MKNIGIVIGVSEYAPPNSSLPACKPDAEAVAKILQIETKFDEVLHIDADTRSSVVKQKIIEFINKQKGQEIGDLVFYFSGHGDFSGDEFYYLLSDYDIKKRKQTALENSELDNLARLLKPKLFVKIVDACHSGVTYIKNTEDFQTYLKSGTPQFKKVYFMFSSQSDQASYQDNKLSYFTRRVIESLVQHSASSIRYKDIIDFVSDAFEGDASQTPFFVTQAEFTEMFSDHVGEAKTALAGFFSPSSTLSPPLGNKQQYTMIERIKADADLYCGEADALERINYLEVLLRQIKFSGELALLYSIEVATEQDPPPGAVSIAQWLDKNKESQGYFFKVTREKRKFTTRVLTDPLKRFMATVAVDEDYKTVTEIRDVITGYSSMVKLPYNYIVLRAEPRYQNLNPAAAFIVPILSMTRMRLFSAYTLYDYVDWKDRKRIGKLEWLTEEVSLRDENHLKQEADSIEADFAAFIEKPIKAKWGDPAEPTKSADTEQTKSADTEHSAK